jgi:hypothetical protein
VELLVRLPILDQLLDGPVVAGILEVPLNRLPEQLVLTPSGLLDCFVPLLKHAVLLDRPPDHESTDSSNDDSLLFVSHFNPFGSGLSLEALFMMRKLQALLLPVVCWLDRLSEVLFQYHVYQLGTAVHAHSHHLVLQQPVHFRRHADRGDVVRLMRLIHLL